MEQVTHLSGKPHKYDPVKQRNVKDPPVSQRVNSIAASTRAEGGFYTAGDDGTVQQWRERNNGWEPTQLHALHDSFGILSKAMGVACIKNLERVVSVSENGSGVKRPKCHAKSLRFRTWAS